MWYIVKNGVRKEAFRLEGEAKKVLADYGEDAEIIFEPRCRLQAKRVAANLSQAELAYISGISIKTIQCYEARSRDINKASGETLRKLAKVLRCRIEDIMEESL